MIFLFLIDTSCSMNQRTASGMSLLDAAKAAVEHFAKCRSRLQHQQQQQQQQQPDRYMLCTTDDNIFTAVKSGWKDSYAHFLDSVKNLCARDMTNLGSALKRSLDLLNQYRLQSGTDSYAMGRYPFYAEPAAVLLITDGGHLTSLASGVSQTLTLPNPPSAHTELTVEPFRWDQRVFSIVLQLPAATAAAAAVDQVASTQADQMRPQQLADHPLAPICEVTGGQCTAVSSMKQLLQHVEELAMARLRFPAVVVNLEPIPATAAVPSGTSKSTQAADLKAFSSPHTTLTMRHMTGLWPIPESYWVAPNKAKSFPARNAQPTIGVLMQEQELPAYVDRFHQIMDKYELDPHSPLARHIITNAQERIRRASKNSPASFSMSAGGTLRSSPSGMSVMDALGNRVYHCFVANSHAKSQLGDPFGFIRCLPAGTSVNSDTGVHLAVTFFVLPYNYPRLLYLLDELLKKQLVPTNQWRQDFENYLQQVPFYYVQPLKIALVSRLKLPTHIIPDHYDSQMPYGMAQYLKKLTKQASAEHERFARMEMLYRHQKDDNAVTGSAAGSNTTATPGPTGTFGGRGANSGKTTDFRDLLARGASPGGSIPTFDESTSVTQATGASVLDSVVTISDTAPPVADQLQPQQTSPVRGSESIALDPLSIPRSELLSQLVSMKLAMYGKGDNLLEDGVRQRSETRQKILKHTIPIAQMGNFDAVLRKKDVLRDPFSDDDLTEWQRKRPHFGSPFQRRKRGTRRNRDKPALSDFLAVDEAETGGSAAGADEVAVPGVEGKPTSPAHVEAATESVPDAPRKPSERKGATKPGSKSKMSPFDMPHPAGLLFGERHKSPPGAPVSPPLSPPESRSPQKRSRHKTPREKETAEDRDKTSVRKKSRSEDDADVIREMATFPGILALSDRIIESIYERQCHLRFSQQNADLEREMRRYIRQPCVRGVGERSQAEMESFVKERLSALKGTPQWKRAFVGRMVRHAQAFHKTRLAACLEQFLGELSR